MGMFKIKINPADKWFSLYIRYRDKWQCQRCLKQYPERSGSVHNSHFWGRGNKSVRYDEENCVALCVYCHQYFTANPQDHSDFFLKRLGKRRFDALGIRARTPIKYGLGDFLIALGYKRILKEMGVNVGKSKNKALGWFTP